MKTRKTRIADVANKLSRSQMKTLIGGLEEAAACKSDSDCADKQGASKRCRDGKCYWTTVSIEEEDIVS